MPVKMGLNDCSLVCPITRQFHAINALITIHHSFQLTNTIYIYIFKLPIPYLIISFCVSFRLRRLVDFDVDYVYLLSMYCVWSFFSSFLLLSFTLYRFTVSIDRYLLRDTDLSLSVPNPFFPYSSNILRSFIWLSLKCA